MSDWSRRSIVQAAVAAGAWSASAQPGAKSSQKMRLGIILSIGKDPGAAIQRVHDFGFPTCQIHAPDLSDATVSALKQALAKYSVEVTSVVCTGPGPEVYDFVHGPQTIGLVPRQYRAARIARMKETSDFAVKAGVNAVQGHCGFIPEDPNDPLFGEAVEAIRTVAAYCKKNGQNFRCETGQETPITLVRAIRATGLDNVGVNFDVANVILYGKANPVDAVDTFAPYIQGVHAKDGLYPTDPAKLGEEVPIGQGKVNFPVLIPKLKAAGYHGPLTIEREISGDKQRADILASKTFLEKLIG